MGWESSDVVRFDIGPLSQGQTINGSLVLVSCDSSGFALVLQCARSSYI